MVAIQFRHDDKPLLIMRKDEEDLFYFCDRLFIHHLGIYDPVALFYFFISLENGDFYEQ